MIIIENYNPNWPAKYEQERATIVQAIGPYIATVEHVGSTSIPGLAAKPIIDICIELNIYPLPAEAITAMGVLGYEHLGEYGIHERHYFRKHGPLGYHVHAYSPDNVEWNAHVLFRDYLLAHPQAARQYEQLKRELATHYTDRHAYTADKTDFVRTILTEAREWRLKNED